MTILHIEVDDEGKTYSVSADKGVSISEICFGISATIKCFLREGLIKDPTELYDLIKRYVDDTSNDLPVEENNEPTTSN